ncbi:hypothetical protein AVEN_184249-1 [Araneus ventricosus]|uniref:Uncharacterized protein n=1 Tax=Araneus ventricosus TaxID=182803 RepID=A0A4Y2PB28_ARAVE|nr:hypothetical protein AVEN_184249-1 [Araneus ventricosus]
MNAEMRKEPVRVNPCYHTVWLGKTSRFVLVDCGRWNSDQSRRSDDAWHFKTLGSLRVNGCTDSVWLPPLPLACELFTVNRCTYTSTSHFVSSCSDDGK